MTRFATPLILASLLAMRSNQSTELPAAPTQAGKGTIPSNQSPRPTASPGRMQLTEPAPLDFKDHEGYLSLFDGVSLKDWDGHPKFWRVENGAIIGESTAIPLRPTISRGCLASKSSRSRNSTSRISGSRNLIDL
jgi:hypothetical protein